jgi:hypothetical protein
VGLLEGQDFGDSAVNHIVVPVHLIQLEDETLGIVVEPVVSIQRHGLSPVECGPRHVRGYIQDLWFLSGKHAWNEGEVDEALGQEFLKLQDGSIELQEVMPFRFRGMKLTAQATGNPV